MKRRWVSIAILAGVCLFTVTSAAAGKPDKKPDPKYQIVQVDRFDQQAGVDLPPDHLVAINEDIVTHIGKIKGVEQVLRDGETLPHDKPVVRITGTITQYKKGSQAKRYLVGFGAGATVIRAHIKCFDASTNELLFESDVDGKVVIGFMGGQSEGANNGVAKEVAKKIKQNFF